MAIVTFCSATFLTKDDEYCPCKADCKHCEQGQTGAFLENDVSKDYDENTSAVVHKFNCCQRELSDRVEGNEHGNVLLGHANQKLQATALWNTVPEDFTGTPIDHEKIENCGEETTIGKELIHSHLWVVNKEELDNDVLERDECRRDYIKEACQCDAFLSFMLDLTFHNRGDWPVRTILVLSITI